MVLGIVKGTILIPQKHLLLLQGVVGEENLPVFGPGDQLVFLVGHTHNDMTLDNTGSPACEGTVHPAAAFARSFVVCWDCGCKGMNSSE